MANINYVQGADLMLFDASGKSIAFATSHALSLSTDSTDVSSKDHGRWNAQQVTKINWEITTENLFTNEEFSKLYDIMIATEPVKVFFGLKASDELEKQGLVHAKGEYEADAWTSAKDNYTYTGYVTITSLSANAQNNEVATFSATFTSAGPLTKVTD